MKNYTDLLQKIINEGHFKDDRTGTGVYSLFGERLEFDLGKGFPLLTTKKIYVKGVITELLWFLGGGDNIRYLQENDCHIWDEWADDSGEIGPMYGYQWRRWGGLNDCDQISQLMRNLKQNPTSRRHIISSWNVEFLPDESLSPIENVKLGKMALAPCHVLAQFYVKNRAISCQVYLRSQDYFLGTPFNIACYAFLTHMIAHQLDFEVDKLIWIAGDVHLYSNHLKQAKLQLTRQCRMPPKLKFTHKPADIFSYRLKDFLIHDYNPHPRIKASISV